MSTVATGNQNELQKTFIAMVFAFAVSIVAQQIAEILVVLTHNWQTTSTLQAMMKGIDGHKGQLLAVATHSFLALLMLSISWVMWSKSQAAGHLEEIKNIFSKKFITFILEVILVTMYYSLAKTAEGDFSEYSKTQSVASYVTKVSAKPEAIQMALIFLIFAFWDLIVDVMTSPLHLPPNGKIRKFLSPISGMVVYCFVSIMCAIAAFFVFKVAPAAELPIHAVTGDLALIVVLLFFNQGKVLEYYLYKLFPWEESRKNTKRVPTQNGGLILIGLTITYFGLLSFIKFPWLQKSLGW